MYIDELATENYDASTLKVYASSRILGNLTNAQTEAVFSFPAKNGLGKRLVSRLTRPLHDSWDELAWLLRPRGGRPQLIMHEVT